NRFCGDDHAGLWQIEPTMKPFAAVFVIGMTGTAMPQTKPAPAIVQADDIVLKTQAPLFGDPSKPGAYIIRMRLTPNQMTRPHFDDQDRFITVLKGTLWLGKGDVFGTDKLLPVREGGVAFLPANSHYFHVAGD